MEDRKIYQKYLRKLGIEKPTSFEEIEDVFFAARKDFFDYKISLD